MTQVNNLNNSEVWKIHNLPLDNSHDLVEAVYNYVAVLHHIRVWSSEGYALLRAGHALRWFYNAFPSHKEQVRVLKEALRAYFHATAQVTPFPVMMLGNL